MTDPLFVRVIGTPAPQGSKKYVGSGRMIESSKKVKPWRAAVKAAATEAIAATGHDTLTGPVSVVVSFVFARPRHHYRTGRFSGLLRDNAPHPVSTRPDLDKCIRSTFDALGDAGVWGDDAQVASVSATKTYAADDDLPGAYIIVRGET